MRRFLAMAASTAVLALATTAQAAGELNIYNWGNYTNPALVEKFTAETGIKINLSDYDSNETMLAKVRAGNPGFDIVVPTEYIVKVMIDEGLLAEVRPDELPNFKNVDPQWVDVYFDPGRHYSVPWQWGTTSFAVDTAVYSGDINTLALMFEPPPELQGKIAMQPSPDEVFNAALRYLGMPLCNNEPADLKKMYEMLLAAKPHWRNFDYSMIEPLVSGTVALSQGWNGAAMRARLQKPTIAYAYPKEGYSLWMDNVTVLSDASNVENAKTFMNFIMDPQNAALISDFAKYANGIKGSEQYMPAEFAAAPEITPPPGTAPGSFVPVCPQEVVERYNQLWTNLLK